MATLFPKTLGVEEEYLLVDLETRALAIDPPKEILEECQRRHEGHVSPEFQRSQIEVGTPVCHSIKEARDQLAELRKSVIEVAGEYGYAPISCSTHPFSRWRDQKATPKKHYLDIEDELQGVVRRLVTCGMHVHVGVETPQMAINLMNQIKYYL